MGNPAHVVGTPAPVVSSLAHGPRDLGSAAAAAAAAWSAVGGRGFAAQSVAAAADHLCLLQSAAAQPEAVHLRLSAVEIPGYLPEESLYVAGGALETADWDWGW